MNRKKVLITGSNGLLGQKLVYQILDEGKFDCIATSRGENRLIRKEGYSFYSMDSTILEEVKSVFELQRPDIVINTAAMTNVDACELEKEQAVLQNETSVENLLTVLQSLQSQTYQPHLIHLSTDFIFDGTHGPLTEDEVPNPLSHYAITKWNAEKRVQASSLKWSIVRTVLVYGLVDNMSRSNIVLWAKGALEKGQNINVVDDQFRSPTLAEDLASGCLLVAEKESLGVYNISGKDFMSILELVQRVAKFWKLNSDLITPSKSETIKQPAKRPPITGFIIDKAVRELGYAPHSFEEGLQVLNDQLEKFKK